MASKRTPVSNSTIDKDLVVFGKEHNLTPRELDIVALLIDKIVSVEQIAAKLSVSPNTVKNHFQKIFQKTKTNAKAELLSNFIHFVVERGGGTASPGTTKPMTIMLADDDPAFGELMTSAFERLPYEVTLKFAADGIEVIEYLKKTEAGDQNSPLPDLMLLDIRMPRMDGYEVLKEIKSNSFTRNIPVIALSGSDDPDDVRKIYSLGGASYLKKPNKFQTLTAAIDTMLKFFGSYGELPRQKGTVSAG